MSSIPVSLKDLLTYRHYLTDRLASGPLDPVVILERARTFHGLGYVDLAAADAYLALTLAEDPDGDDFFPTCEAYDGTRLKWPDEGHEELVIHVKGQALALLVKCLASLGCLRDAWTFWMRLKEFRDDYDDGEDVGRLEGEMESLNFQSTASLGNLYGLIAAKYRQLSPSVAETWDGKLEHIASQLPNFGLARREIYPWNQREPDRMSKETLEALNERLKEVAPRLEARVSELPDLGWKDKARSPRRNSEIKKVGNDGSEFSNKNLDNASASQHTVLQLGLFAKTSLPPGTEILREKSILTAIRATDASLCNACAAPLPDLCSEHPPIACEYCDSTVFCSVGCKDAAMADRGYHIPRKPRYLGDHQNEDDLPAWPFCDNEYGLEDIGRDANSSSPSDDLYFLLITRTIAMAEHRGCHPLDLEEVKYLWGEFEPFTAASLASLHTLPFSLHHNIILPLRYFTVLLLSDSKYTPYSAHWLANYDFWVLQTLYAKLRGVASARQSTWDGKPEVAAVHWRWCLANHSCAPGVEWAWGAGTQGQSSDGQHGNGDIVFRVREKPVWRRPNTTNYGTDHRDTEDQSWEGIRGDEEILSHYCDVEMPVVERRGWAKGALGGDCRCERCLWETGESQQREL